MAEPPSLPSPAPLPPPGQPEDPTQELGGEALALCGLLILCLLASHLVIHFKSKILPESSAAVLVGVVFGLVISHLKGTTTYWTFDPNVFFTLLLPPIIFEAGYSLKRRLFVANFGPILTFAVVGTLISTVVVALSIQLGGAAGWISDSTFGGLHTAQGIHNSLIFAALLGATDPVATLSVLSSPEVNADATLQAILFGESVLNDAVAIVLFQVHAHACACRMCMAMDCPCCMCAHMRMHAIPPNLPHLEDSPPDAHIP